MFDPSDSHAEQVIRKVEAPEKDELILRLENRWKVEEHYWFPIDTGANERPAHVEAFQPKYFEEELTYDTLDQILAEHGVTTLFEKREGDIICEIELEQFYPLYTGLEGFWFTEQLDWVIYASHESSITVGGEWLLAEVKRAWPNWEQRVWTPHFYK